MNHGKQPLSTLLWQAFYQHAQRETQINVLFIDSDPAVRLSLCGPVRLVVWAWLLAFFFLYVWVCVLMSRCIMDGWKPCWNALSWPKIFGYAAAGLGQACLLEDTHWVAPMSIANVNMGWSLLSSPLEKKKILLILNNEHWTAQWPTWIICMAAYLRYDNRARCPGWFKQTSDEFHQIGIA